MNRFFDQLPKHPAVAKGQKIGITIPKCYKKMSFVDRTWVQAKRYFGMGTVSAQGYCEGCYQNASEVSCWPYCAGSFTGNTGGGPQSQGIYFFAYSGCGECEVTEYAACDNSFICGS